MNGRRAMLAVVALVALVALPAVGAFACAPRAVVRSTVSRNARLPSVSGFVYDDAQCAALCGAPQRGERLLWCHTANLDVEDASPTRSDEVLVCNYGAE